MSKSIVIVSSGMGLMKCGNVVISFDNIIEKGTVEKLVRKYYKTEEKQRRMLEMLHRKLDNLGELGEMFSSYSKLYLYEKEKNKESGFQSDYLLVHETGKKILYLGLVKSERGKGIYHCNSFMTTYQNDRDRDSFFRDLPYRYEITRIVRENKDHEA